MPQIGRPAGTFIDIFPIEELSISDREYARATAREEAARRAIAGNIATTPAGLTLRSIRPDADLDFGAVTYEQWLTPAMVAATELAVVNNVTLDVRSVLVIYGFFCDEPNPGASELRFRQNTGGTVPLALVNVQHLRSNLVNKGILSELIAYDPQDIMNIAIMPSITDAAGQVMGFLGYVAEPKGRSFIGPTV